MLAPFAPRLRSAGSVHLQAGLYTPSTPGKAAQGVTNHSVRKTGAEWAARCGGSLQEISATGRWLCVATVERYMKQGKDVGEEKRQNNAGVSDPIREFWIYRPTHRGTQNGQSAWKKRKRS